MQDMLIMSGCYTLQSRLPRNGSSAGDSALATERIFTEMYFEIKVNDFKDLHFSLIDIGKLTKDRLLYDQWLAMSWYK